MFSDSGSPSGALATSRPAGEKIREIVRRPVRKPPNAWPQRFRERLEVSASRKRGLNDEDVQALRLNSNANLVRPPGALARRPILGADQEAKAPARIQDADPIGCTVVGRGSPPRPKPATHPHERWCAAASPPHPLDRVSQAETFARRTASRPARAQLQLGSAPVGP